MTCVELKATANGTGTLKVWWTAGTRGGSSSSIAANACQGDPLVPLDKSSLLVYVRGSNEATAQVMAALRMELATESRAASANRLLIEQLTIGRISLLLDLHASHGSRHIPVAIDTHRCTSTQMLLL